MPRFDAPQHLYSHRVGTFLDALLDNADEVAKGQAQVAWPWVGWIWGLQEPRVCFTHNTIQIHNVDHHMQSASHQL